MATYRQTKIPAMYVRGGTSKGVFFSLSDLPEWAQKPGPDRDRLLLRVIGSPDPYGKQIDGLGGATSSTSKVVIISPSQRPGHDIDYLFGQVSIDQQMIDWTGNCGNLTAAVGVFALEKNMLSPLSIESNSRKAIKIWQVNIQKTIVAHIPLVDGQVQELGEFELDGVTFPSAEIPLTFVDPADAEGDLFPTGQTTDTLQVPSSVSANGELTVTMINSGIPTVFVASQDIGLAGTELQPDINENEALLAKFELIRSLAAVKMGLIDSVEQAQARQHTPKVAFVSQAQAYQSSSGKAVGVQQIDLVVRALSMGKLHHAMMGTAAVAIASAAAVPGTLVSRCLSAPFSGQITFGHPSGTLTVGAIASQTDGKWAVDQVTMSRSARILMEGQVRVPSEV